MKKAIFIVLALVFALGLAACGGGTGAFKEVDLTKVMAAIQEQVKPQEMMELQEGNLMDYYGIDPVDVKQFAASISETGLKASEIVMMEAVDADAATRIKEKLEGRLQQLINSFNNYLPEEYAIAKDCKVESYGNYVTLFVSDKADRMKEIFESYIE